MKRREQLRSLRDMTPEQLSSRLRELKEDAMRLRFRKASGQLARPAEIPAVTRQIARVLTVIEEKQKGQVANS